MVGHNLFCKLLILVHLDYFQLFNIINNAATNTPNLIFFLILASYFFRRDFRSGMTEAKGIKIVKSFVVYYQIASPIVKTLALPAVVNEGPISVSSPAMSISSFVVII